MPSHLAVRSLCFLVGLFAPCMACSAGGSGGGETDPPTPTTTSSTDGGAGSGGSSTASGAGGSASTYGGQIGDACATDADCTVPPDAECWTTIGGGMAPEITFPGGYCSKDCDPESSDNECGDVAGCSSFGVSGGQGSVTLTMCAPPCGSDAECREDEGYRCLQLLPGIGVCTL